MDSHFTMLIIETETSNVYKNRAYKTIRNRYYWIFTDISERFGIVVLFISGQVNIMAKNDVKALQSEFWNARYTPWIY